MKHQIFSVFDHKIEAYLPPFYTPKIAVAHRAFSDCINSPTHQFGKHPADYTLFYLGEWCDQLSNTPVQCCTSHGNGLVFVQPKLTSPDQINEVNSNPSLRPNGEGRNTEV